MPRNGRDKPGGSKIIDPQYRYAVIEEIQP
jgi:hypothetical protein